MKFRVAVVQFEIKQFNPGENLKRAENFISEASQKADVIIFPEDFVTGPIIKKKKFVDFDGKYLKHFQMLSRKHSIDIVTGSWIEGTSNGWYNTSYYIDKTGAVLGKYRKNNLWHPERRYLTPGNEICVFNTRFGKAGIVICWDLIFPEIFRKMVREGVKLVFCPSYWCYGDAGKGRKFDPNSEIKLVDSLCVGRAFENEIILIYCNAAGKLSFENIRDTLLGHSQVTVPFKGCIKKSEHNKEEMFIQEIDTSILDVAEQSYKIREYLRNRAV